MRIRTLVLVLAALCIAAIPAMAQFSPADSDRPAAAALARRPWEFGPFFQGGTGVAERSNYQFTAAGFRLGKIITGQHLSGHFRGQFELAGEVMPYWQAFTPAPHVQATTVVAPGVNYTYYVPFGGGAFTGASLTPVIFRWDFKPGRRIAPWFQAAGGLVYTTHKFPPDVLVPHGLPGATSVWNFSPQGGIGLHYFIRPGRAITLAASGVHISSASLGDHNPGVNASVMFQIGYTFFSR